MRVISLVPSVTETLLAWGTAPVACTRFCEQPAIPTVGGTKNPDIEAIVGLQPDVVVMDEEENRREDHQALTAAGLATHVLAIRSVTDVARQLPRLARAVGTEAGPAPTVEVTAPASRARVFVPIWRRPWMALGPGTYGASLLESIGLTVVPDGGSRYAEVDLDHLTGVTADLVIVPSEPYAFTDAHLRDLRTVAPTVRVDGRDLFWWGARTADARHRLATQLATWTGA